MKTFMDLCLARQSCRDFADKEVEREKLAACVEAARLTPSGCNSQPWRFVVVESPDVAAVVAQAGQPMNMNPYITKAKAFFVILEEHAVLLPHVRAIVHSQYFAKSDMGAAMYALCLAAEEQGLGTCILGLFDREKIAKAIGAPRETRIAGLIAVGYPASDKVRKKDRKPLEEIVRYV